MTLDTKNVGQSFRLALLLIILVEVMSFWGFLFPVFSSVAMVVTCLLVLILAFVRYDLAILVFLAELFVGSQGGYLFTFGLEGGLSLSLRMGLFLAIFSVWAIRSLLSAMRVLRKAEDGSGGLEWLAAMRRTGILWPYLALLGVFAVAGVRGLLTNGFADTFFDANGYAFFAILPAIVAGVRRMDLARFVGVYAGAVTASVIKALTVHYIFSHRMQVAASPIYTWIRDTRVGEITIQTADFYRIFFQAHLFGLMLAIIAVLFAAYADRWRSRAYLLSVAAVAVSSVALLLGLSRSFWFGLFGGAAVIIVAFVWGKADAGVWKRTVLGALTALVLAIAVISSVYAVPFPKKASEFSFSNLLGDRVTSMSDDAAVSRWALLPVLHQAALRHPVLGSGFGARVEYRTSDPRLLADNPTGIYSTFAFEWGYQDLWLKLGLLGLAVYGWLIVTLIRPLLSVVRKNRQDFRSSESAGNNVNSIISLGLLAAVAALLATNVFSPYLNHPLGIGTLALLAGWSARDV